MSGIPSSRKVERATYDSIAFRYIAANTHPDRDTLVHLRRRFGAQFEQLFLPVPCWRARWACSNSARLGIMKVGSGGFDQCYNCQVAVGTDSVLIVAAFVTQAGNDSPQIAPMLAARTDAGRP